ATTAKDVAAAYEGLEDFLRSQEDREDVRRAAVRLAMSPVLGRPADARFHLEQLLGAKPSDSELELLYARCLLAEKKRAEAARWLARVIEHSPRQVDGYVLHAFVLREHLAQRGEADAVMDRMVQNVGSARAYLARSLYRRQHAMDEQARQRAD